jgi:hypothetical protein
MDRGGSPVAKVHPGPLQGRKVGAENSFRIATHGTTTRIGDYLRRPYTIQQMKHIITTLALGLALSASAQSYNDLVEIVRADLRTEHQAILLANMGLSEEESATFTPHYDAYSTAMKAHWDKRIALVKEYAEAYEKMDDETAKAMMAKMTGLEHEALKIRDEATKKMMKDMSPITVARFAQIERRLASIIELQLADEIPLMPAKN